MHGLGHRPSQSDCYIHAQFECMTRFTAEEESAATSMAASLLRYFITVVEGQNVQVRKEFVCGKEIRLVFKQVIPSIV